MIDDGAKEIVLDQLPPAGASLVKGGHVMVYTEASNGVTPQTLVCVPDLAGMSDVDCARMLRQRGLAVSFKGSGICVKQSPAAGEYVAPGSGVSITLESTGQYEQ